MIFSPPHDLDRTALVGWAIQVFSSGPLHLRRQLVIQRLSSVGPFGPPREPSILDPALPISFNLSRSRKIRRWPRHLLPPVLALRQRHGQREGGEIVRVQRLVPSSSGQRLCAHLLPVAHRPRWSSFTCSRRPRCSLAGQSTRGGSAVAPLPWFFLISLACSLGFFYPSQSSSQHPRFLLGLESPSSSSPPLLPLLLHGEGGNPWLPFPVSWSLNSLSLRWS